MRSPIIRRREWLMRAAGLGGAAAFTRPRAVEADAARATPRPRVPDDPTKVPGTPPSELGQRSPFEHPRRRVHRRLPSGESETPLQDLRGIITPSDLHFERHHAGVPAIDPERYRLLVHGMVEHPTVFTLGDLKRFPSRSQICFLECSGNGGPGYREIKRECTPQQVDGLTSTSNWTGVPLSILFREVGVKPGARWFLAEGQDAAVMARSIPLAKAGEDAMVAYAQNGEPLRPEQGYPARLLLPGWEGNSNVKWLRRLKALEQPAMSREETSKYTDLMPDGTARQFTFLMEAKSLITRPSGGDTLAGPGFYEVTGIAWSGRGTIVRVEITVDDGVTWAPAELQMPV